MRKLFLKSVTLLFLLVMSVNAAWAGGSAFNAVLQQLAQEKYFAEMTGKPSVTGSGKVYVDRTGDCPSDWSDLNESNAATLGIGACVEGMEMVQVPFKLYCKAKDGWYFKGWSYTEGGSDLDSIKREDGDTKDFDSQIFVKVNPSNAEGSDKAAKYTMFATFEKIYISSYSVSGNTTVAKGESVTQTVTFTLTGKNIDIADFETPTIENVKENAGTWACVGGVNVNGTAKTATVSVQYTALNKDGVESSATLRLATKSNSVMEVPLAARTSVSEDVEAMLYDGDIRQKETITTVSELLNVNISGYKKPILKLNRDYGELTISKNLTLDLNGYNLASLTSTGDKVTLAYSVYGGNITGAVKVNAGQLTMAGGTIDGEVTIKTGATLIQNGATINAETTNHGTMKTTDGVHTATVKSDGTLSINGGTFTPVSGVAIDITGGTADIKKGTIEGETYGVQSAATTTIEKLAEISGKTKALKINSGTTTINCGKFVKPENLADGTIVFKSAYFKEKTGVVDEKVQGKQLWRNTSGAEFRDGYNFFAGEYAAAKSANVSVCRIGNISFSSLEDALAYANTNADKEVVIVMINDYVMPAGYYTLPAKALLLIPMSEKQDAGFKIPNRNSSADVSYIPPTKYLKLTLADGVNLDVYGTIEVSGSQLSTNDSYTGAPYGPYGQLQMNKGSRMTLQNESELRAWGFVTGDVEHKNTATHEVPMGEIDARRGSLVQELFQMGDWKDFAFSGRGLLANAGSLGEEIFPITQYYIQNVEVPVKYHPGAHLNTATSVYANIPDAMIKQIAGSNPLGGDMQVVMTANHIQIIGADTDDAMFLMNEKADAENTWVRKWYDASKDQQVYEINSGAHIGKLVIPLVYVLGGEDAMLNMNSAAYNLPITCNFKLHLLNGDMDFTQSTELLPGSEVEVDKEARVYVSEPEDKVRGGYLYLYDWQDWDIFAGTPTEPNVYARKIKYTPSFNDGVNNGAVPDEVRDVSSPQKIGSASVNVHGTFDTQGGYVYTTEHGANIFSSIEDAGTFLFSNAAASDPATIQQVKNINAMGVGTKVETTCYPAWLRNSDEWVASNTEEDQYTETSGTSEGRSFCFLDIDGNGGRWTDLEQRGCFTFDGANNSYYIKPQEYVEVMVSSAESVTESDMTTWNITGNSDHTFSDAAGTGRLFILLTDNQGNNCQWWEVEKKDNLYHCIHPDNDTYYYWDDEREIDDEPVPGWAEKTFTITWKDWNGQIIKDAKDNDIVYTVPYGTQAEWLSSKPTRESTQDYTYTFTGWSPALAKVTSDVTYTATYEEKPIKYAVYFLNDNGVEIEHHMLARNEFPICENTPTRTGYTLQWSPKVQAVTGEATYTATWTLIPPDEYEITFCDYNGTTLLKPKENEDPYMVAVGTMPTPPTETPSGKPSTSEYDYVFDHWSPEIVAVSAEGPKVYTAVYREQPKTFPVKFYYENKETQIGETQYVEIGQTPVIPNDQRLKNTDDNTNVYKLVWTPQIQTVTGHANDYTYEYVASYETTPKQYALTLKTSPAGAATLTGARTDYAYNASATITVTPASDDYTFTGWSDGAVIGEKVDGKYTRTVTMSDNKELTALFEYKGAESVTIKWMNGNELIGTSVQKQNTPTAYSGSTPEKSGSNAQYTYIFDGWTVASDGSGTVYRNGVTPKATTDITYYAHFKQETKKYTVSWKNEAGTANLEVDLNQPYGAEVAYNSATPTKTPDEAAIYTFDGWSTSVGGAKVALPATVKADADYFAHFSSTPQTYLITWNRDDGSLIDQTRVAYGTIPSHTTPEKPADEQYTYEFDHWDRDFVAVTGAATYIAIFNEIPLQDDLEIGIGDTETLTEDTEKDNLIITSNGVSSGQLINANHLTTTKAYFDLTIDVEARQWYAVAVPWQVDAETGVLADGNALTLGSDFDLIYYDGEYRASSHENNSWKYVEDDGDKTMQPGKLYMIVLLREASVIRFVKKDGAGILTTSTSVSTFDSNVTSDANWNGIANPALYYASIDAGNEYGHFWNISNQTWDPVELSTIGKLVVAQPFFVQSAINGSVVAKTTSYAAPARRKVAETKPAKYTLQIATNGHQTDRLFVIADENKEENEYIIGKDLAKITVANHVAQMWVNRYNAELCVNTMAPVNGVAEYPLSIYTPNDGEYVLSTEQQNGDKSLYLTKNGEAIANLSDGAFTLDLEKGTTTIYGLRISARVPQVATDLGAAVVDADGKTTKVLYNGQVFIIRGEKVYTVDGQLVK